MTVIVEDGTGSNPLANSYIDVNFANDYHEGTVYADAWNASNPAQKAQAVVNASRMIDGEMLFNGYIVNTEQPLKWPRMLVPRDEVATYPYGYPSGMATGYYYYPSDSLPLILQQATAVAALELLVQDRATDDQSQGLSSVSVGDIAIAFAASGGGVGLTPISDRVANMLSPLGSPMTQGFGIVKVERVM